MAYYQKTAEQVLHEFKTSEKGLSHEEAKQRIVQYGFNEIKAEKKTSAIEIFFEQFKNLMILILIGAALISIAFDEINDALVILAIVVINAVVGFLQEYKAERALEALMAMAAPKAKIVRDGQEMTIETKEVVPGDILALEAGDRISADARVIFAAELRTQEAALTGESIPRPKIIDPIDRMNLVINDQKNMLFAGTDITDGRGQAVVVRTGMNTEFGKVASLTQTIEKGKTTLQKELDLVGKFIGKGTFVICTIVFFAELIQSGSIAMNAVINAFLFAVALAVAAVPEGLPTTITITLALGVQRLVKKNVIIKKLNAVETLGCTSVICSDKTGTLTKNEMTVKEIFVNDNFMHVSGSGYTPKGQFSINKQPIRPGEEPNLIQLLTIGAACNNAHLISINGRHAITGDPTEGALVVVAEKADIELTHIEEHSTRIHEIPFDSTRKMMSTIHKKPHAQLVYVKGAPDEILKHCNKIQVRTSILPLTPIRKEHVLKANETMANEALRVLGFAYKEIPKDTKQYKREEIESGLTFVGLMGMIDPPREEVPASIAECKQAGMKIFVITGDHGATAKAIAKHIGLADEHTRIIEGSHLIRMQDHELESLLHENVIFARVTPEHKLRIVTILEKMGHIVAVTGDGVNDAPALKKASIGVEIGRASCRERV